MVERCAAPAETPPAGEPVIPDRPISTLRKAKRCLSVAMRVSQAEGVPADVRGILAVQIGTALGLLYGLREP